MRILILALTIIAFTTSTSSASPQIPEGMVVQSLPEVRGEILRPKSWHYRKIQDGNPFQFTISREDSRQYITGLKQAVFANVKALTGNSAEVLAANFIVSNRSATSKTCGTQNMNGYLRYCLEDTVNMQFDGIEIPMRIVHTIMWSNTADLTVVSVFGAPESEWDSLKNERAALSLTTLFVK